MKVVLFSVLMLTTAVHAAPKHARLSWTGTATENRRPALLKGEKYFEGLHTGDPFPGRVRVNKHRRFRELFLPRSERRGIRRGKDMSYSPHAITRREEANGYRKPGFLPNFHRSLAKEAVLNFRSPEQLQEYLFSEAANAKHILRSGVAFYSPSNQLEIGSDAKPYNDRFSKGRGDPAANRRGNGVSRLSEWNYKQQEMRPRRQKHRPFHKNWMEARQKLPDLKEGRNEEYSEPKYRNYLGGRRPIFLHPYDMPYLYPPPWYDPRTQFFLPYDRKLYETPSSTPRSTPKPNREIAFGNDLVKLKQMVDELDALSEETQNGGASTGKSDTEKHEKDRNETIADMKEKIDKVIIPILNKISRDLNGTAPSGSSSPLPKKTENPEGDGKKNREKDKEGDIKQEPHLKHNFPCRIDGLWVCTLDALHLNISTLPNMTLKVSVVSENPKKNGYITKDWAINGITLATTGGPFLLAAVCPEKRKVASFIGQCRSCKEEDIISGLWTFSTAGKDCAEIFTSFETKIDVFRRDKSQQRKVDKSAKSYVER